jgi:hypothetical protein
VEEKERKEPFTEGYCGEMNWRCTLVSARQINLICVGMNRPDL